MVVSFAIKEEGEIRLRLFPNKQDMNGQRYPITLPKFLEIKANLSRLQETPSEVLGRGASSEGGLGVPGLDNSLGWTAGVLGSREAD